MLLTMIIDVRLTVIFLTNSTMIFKIKMVFLKKLGVLNFANVTTSTWMNLKRHAVS